MARGNKVITFILLCSCGSMQAGLMMNLRPPDIQQIEPEWLPVPPGVAPQVPYPEEHWSWEALRTTPLIDPSAWVAPGAVVYGRVRLQAYSSVWYGAIVRGDHEWIDIGEETNIQDGAILHVDPGYPCLLGNRVTLGHRALVHASIVEDDCLIAIGATVLSRCIIGQGALIAAGATVLEGTRVPPRTLWAGCPARQIKELTPDQQTRMQRTYRHYVNNALAHRVAMQQPGGHAHSPSLPPPE